MKSILVVDDEEAIVLALELVLTSEGFGVLTASNGQEALQRLAEHPVDMVLLDVMMPVMSGLEALQKLRADPRFANLVIVLMSAARPTARKEDFGWNAYLSKPFEADRLLELIERLLGPEND